MAGPPVDPVGGYQATNHGFSDASGGAALPSDAAPTTIAVADAPAAGASALYSRGDHLHGSPAKFTAAIAGFIGPLTGGVAIGRALDVTFTPNATRPTLLTMCVTVVAPAVAQAEGYVELQSDSAATPATNRGRIGLEAGGGGVENKVYGCVTYIVPPGDKVRFHTETVGGAPVFALVVVNEQAL